MARTYITDMQMPRTYWFWAIPHANQIQNYIPCKVNDELTTPFELVHGVKLDYRILFRLLQQNPQCNDCVYDDSQERVKGKR
jgi:predicted Zn-ribbon and HTH transcriptional regulator